MNAAPADSNYQATRSSAANADGKEDVEYYVNLLKAWHARIKKEVEQWIPLSPEEIEARSPDHSTPTSQKEDISLLFRPERAGLGAEHLLPEVSGGGGTDNSFASGTELEKLRKQLLGKKAQKTAENAAKNKLKISKNGSGHSQNKGADGAEALSDDSGSDEGRSSVFRSKRANQMPLRTAAELPPNTGAVRTVSEPLDSLAVKKIGQASNGLDNTFGEADGAEDALPTKRKRSFLDEVLAEKNRRKTKKKHKS